ncbi:hypothetical protein JNB_17868 [Janibacter sp. HTCC2649]|uniref:type II toxin-antitoxin system VapC family toxin n=1 Tax=Janibacter sp. HTCC2649 TaxID=313589 RepID=UPI000067101F|nr:type II toxin-antitoxin system VapC family toxin [Janibacter sp. HTCC2649]EAP97362.1 hypothetical protein JNB_17868 [Janibacter sp. HTCC2649]
MILLDSNALLWLVTGGSRLGPMARHALGGPGVPAYFSPVSVVELTIKKMLGKLDLMGPVSDAAGAAGLRELPLNGSQAEGIVSFPSLVRHDPFDRMLLAQARIEGMRLLTSDRVLLSAEPELTIDARA